MSVQARSRAGRWAEGRYTDPGITMLDQARRPHTLLPRSTRTEARQFLAGLTYGQLAVLTIDGHTGTYMVERELGPADGGGEHPDSNGVTFRVATGCRSYRRRVTIAEVAAGFAPTVCIEAEWQRAGRSDTDRP